MSAMQELSQALGPEGSLRRSVDLSIGGASENRRHSLAFPVHAPPESSMCSSPHETVHSAYTAAGSGMAEVCCCDSSGLKNVCLTLKKG
jgi:hypothetical protein